MPHINGYELAKKIREINPSVPILMMSGSSSPQKNFFEIGNISFITKPFELKELKFTINNILSIEKGNN